MAIKHASEQVVDNFEAAIRSGQEVERRRAELLSWIDGIGKVKDAQFREISRLRLQLSDLTQRQDERDGVDRSEAAQLRARFPRGL